METSSRTTRRGNCYVVTEALYHILGGKESGWEPRVMRLPTGDTHWFLAKWVRVEVFNGCWREYLEVLDSSRLQFMGQLPDYYLGRRCGFMTRQPSKRARDLMYQMTWSVKPCKRKRSSGSKTRAKRKAASS